ncbi:OmpA family protein [Pseudidiomarina andamanensis]|nr:OmpA family protein [Pseudidiomarina andamanensis]MDS0218925.1 OmpA family protein [Pseudidiomarina andamanensis]
MMKKLAVAVAVSSLVVTGCANMSNTQKGATIGAIAGAVIGKGTGDHDKSRYVWGAVAGAIAGGAIGAYMDKQEREFREELAGSGVQVIRDGDNIRLQLPSNVTFAVDSTTIASSFDPVLVDVAKVLNRYEKTTMLVEGHTDSTGDANYNQRLSENRALAVRNHLVGNGVDQRRVTTVGYGETMPVADNSTADGRQLNRRVELRIVPNEA